ncbi:hypothetical protein [Sporosalibacterium faouarense]|uniref:hypothetical protein n=1 Tax=Sporosalibacterium faouarense TaxID=516123 RepID=UPI00192A9869|nr:hypothetical protein [Sporosalibacterium faouarense]
MKSKNILVGIIFVIIILIVIEMYGPLYIFHTEKSALRFAAHDILRKFKYDSYSLTTDISIWDKRIPKVEVLVLDYNEIKIPSEFKGKFDITNSEHYQLPYTVDNLVKYELRFEIPLIKKGLNDWGTRDKMDR